MQFPSVSVGLPPTRVYLERSLNVTEEHYIASLHSKRYPKLPNLHYITCLYTKNCLNVNEEHQITCFHEERYPNLRRAHLITCLYTKNCLNVNKEHHTVCLYEERYPDLPEELHITRVDVARRAANKFTMMSTVTPSVEASGGQAFVFYHHWDVKVFRQGLSVRP